VFKNQLSDQEIFLNTANGKTNINKATLDLITNQQKEIVKKIYIIEGDVNLIFVLLSELDGRVVTHSLKITQHTTDINYIK